MKLGASGGVPCNSAEVLALRIYMDNQRLMRILCRSASDDPLSCDRRSYPGGQIIDNSILARNAVSAIN
jgi:hypothetical protein